MKKKLVKMGLAGLMLVAASTFAFAKMNGPKAAGEKGPHKKHHIEIPDLTDAQRDQMKKIKMTAKKATLPMKAAMQEKEARLKTLSIAENPDMGAITSLVGEISDLRGDMRIERIKSQQAIRKILSEDQRVVFDAHMMEKGHRKDKMRGMHPGKGHGEGHHRGHHRMDEGATPPPADQD